MYPDMLILVYGCEQIFISGQLSTCHDFVRETLRWKGKKRRAWQ